jgi:D-xylose transport system substrate-binding protein
VSLRRFAIALAVVSALTAFAACSRPSAAGIRAQPIRIGVILPDSKSSARWETADRRYLEAAFKAAGVDYDIEDAQNDRAAFQSIADRMINDGVDVLMIVNLDSRSGKAVLDRARTQGIQTIDYDRLTVGGSASYYVSFDGVRVGQLQGQGLATCLAQLGVKRPLIAELNGGSDHNAYLFKTGYDSVLDPLYAAGTMVKGPDQSVPDWDNAQAATIFTRMMARYPNIDGVLAVNDGLADAAIGVLRRYHRAGLVPVTGQDATIQGLQSILTGEQCMTVYKAIKRQADAAASLAVALARHEPGHTEQTFTDPSTHRRIPSVLLDPVAIYRANIKDVIADGFVTRVELCPGTYATACAAAGIT